MMIYEIRWRNAGTEEPFEPLPGRDVTSDGEYYQRTTAMFDTLFDGLKEFRLFSICVDDKNWVPVHG